jgi:hypothetical protein
VIDVKVRITTVDDDQGWLDSAGINYKVNEIVEMSEAEFDRLNVYANSVNNEVCGPAISVEDVTASQENDAEAIELMKRFADKS